MKYLWDTNTVIYYLQKQFPPTAEKFVDGLLTEVVPCISVITEIELLSWKAASEKDAELLQSFINDVQVIDLDRNIKFKTADIRKAYKVKLPDAIIAASALVYDLTLVTRNSQDFENIAKLNLLNPWKQ